MGSNRRDFLKDTGTGALWAAPALTVLMTAGGMPAEASGGYGSSSNGKVTICHKGNTISVDASAVPAHLMEHGDSLGSCSN